LTVRDNGPGIPDGRKASLFTADGTVGEGGGLALVGTLVDGYDGRVRVADNEPRGTVVAITLPRPDRVPDSETTAG